MTKAEMIKTLAEKTGMTKADSEKAFNGVFEVVKEELEKGNEYDLSSEEKAFFDALGADPEIKELMQDETLVQIAKELVEIINENKSELLEIKASGGINSLKQAEELINVGVTRIGTSNAVKLMHNDCCSENHECHSNGTCSKESDI